MHLALIDWIIIASSFLLYLFVGLKYAKQAGKNTEEFFLGGRKMGWLLAGVSMVATTFAADTPLAVAEIVGNNGISGNWLWWSFLAGGMLTTFFFANLWRRSGVLTEVELIELRYHGKPAKLLRGFKAIYLGVFINCIIIAWVNVAMSSILQVFFDLSPEKALFYTALAMAFVAVYTSVSGLMGVAVTDAVQFVIAMTGCIILAILVVSSEKIGGINGLKEQVNAVAPGALNFFPTIGANSGGAKIFTISAMSFFAYLGIQWWASWYPGAEPGGGGYVAQRMMGTKSEKDAVYATLFFQIAHYCIRPWPWILVGLAAMVLYPNLTGGDVKLGFVYAMKDFLPNGLKGMLLVAFFAAYMSTIATQLNWGTSYVVNDFYKRFIKPNASEKQLVTTARITTIILMIIGLAVSTKVNSISGAWSFLMECGAGLGLVLILRWYWWRINAWSEIAATIAPFVIYTIISILRTQFPENTNLIFPNSFLITVFGTTIIWIVVTFLTKPTATATLQNFYDKVQPDGAWSPFRNQSTYNNSNLINLFICWISGICFTYSTLFFIGKLILAEWKSAFIFGATLLVSLLIFTTIVKKTTIFK